MLGTGVGELKAYVGVNVGDTVGALVGEALGCGVGAATLVIVTSALERAAVVARLMEIVVPSVDTAVTVVPVAMPSAAVTTAPT